LPEWLNVLNPKLDNEKRISCYNVECEHRRSFGDGGRDSRYEVPINEDGRGSGNTKTDE